jgi:mono/diheme cytochrome c family protein
MVGFPEASPRNRLRDVRRLVLLFAALVLVVAVPACGGEEDVAPLPETVEGTLPADTGGGATEGDAAKGKAIYASAGCGGCHTYSEAGSTGTVGPNLDDSSIDFAGAVEQIKNGGGGMPPFGDRLSDQEIADVAAFVTQ